MRCRCGEALESFRYLGADERYGEASVLRCPNCGTFWLHYHYELESEPRSGRWFLGEIPAQLADTATAMTARGILEGLSSYRCGGSYFNGETFETSGAILL